MALISFRFFLYGLRQLYRRVRLGKSSLWVKIVREINYMWKYIFNIYCCFAQIHRSRESKSMTMKSSHNNASSSILEIKNMFELWIALFILLKCMWKRICNDSHSRQTKCRKEQKRFHVKIYAVRKLFYAQVTCIQIVSFHWKCVKKSMLARHMPYDVSNLKKKKKKNG